MIRIVSDGTMRTRVTNEDGTEIKGIMRIEWAIDARQDKPAEVRLIFDPIFAQVDVQGELQQGDGP